METRSLVPAQCLNQFVDSSIRTVYVESAFSRTCRCSDCHDSRRLSTLIAVRVVVSTLLLGWAILIQISQPGAFPVDPFFFLIGLTYALSVLYFATLRFAERHPWLVDLQLAADALIVSAFIHVTGGITSYFSSLYLLPIMAASTVRGSGGALQVAALSAILYLTLVVDAVRRPAVLAGAAAPDARRRAADAAVRAVHRRDQPVRLRRRGVAVRIAGREPAIGRRATGGSPRTRSRTCARSTST